MPASRGYGACTKPPRPEQWNACASCGDERRAFCRFSFALAQPSRELEFRATVKGAGPLDPRSGGDLLGLMADVFTKQVRSRVMSAIRSAGNVSTELRLVALMRLHAVKGWRRGSQLPGKPDFVFPSLRLAVFVDGCFWHGCPRCSRGVDTNGAFWREKIAGNRRRDLRVSRRLRGMGWRVLRIREHEIRAKSAQIPGRLVRAAGPAPK